MLTVSSLHTDSANEAEVSIYKENVQRKENFIQITE